MTKTKFYQSENDTQTPLNNLKSTVIYFISYTSIGAIPTKGNSKE